ncbi:MAG: phospholipase D-like domain-containing anti-phage protein [Candidatus Dormibacteraceae bacterium]
MIHRYSSRRGPLASFLPERLRGARGYDRIAGFFSSSIVEIAGEALDTMAPGAVARVVANSRLDALDVATARAAKAAMYQEWCASLPEDVSPALKARLDRLYRLLSSGRLRVKVLPDACLGLVHGKAGVITAADGKQVCFLGSANESRTAWALNYEIVWSDDSPEGTAWVQEEFDALWSHPKAFDLADAVAQDAGRLARREVIAVLGEWKDAPSPDPAPPVVELPIYRREDGLWAHQKSFVKLAFEQHLNGGARLVLADQVGLGKTVQLALAAKLTALWGGGTVLVLAPRSLLSQWQEELWRLLELPTAIWTAAGWEDEQGVLHPASGIEDLRRCPRRVGLVSTGLINHSPEAAGLLASLTYECVILDEAHRARRRNLGVTHRNEAPDPNLLLRFLQQVAPRTRSLLLATATPVQLDPIEAWDLLDALNRAPGGRSPVLGNEYSPWRRRARQGLAYVIGREEPPASASEIWEWLRDPFPPADENREFAILRRDLNLPDEATRARPDALDALTSGGRRRVQGLRETLFRDHNPFIRHIVRRTRDYLETTLDPETGEPYLPRVQVRLFGERADQAVTLPTFLQDAYDEAEHFCTLVGQRAGLNSAFLKTMLLRRVGSTIEAGRRTALRMLGPDSLDGEDDDESAPLPVHQRSALYPLPGDEEAALHRFLTLLEGSGVEDPKAVAVEQILFHGAEGSEPWLDRGCIVFTQYYDSATWLAERLSRRLGNEPLALYAGGGKSGVWRDGRFTRLERDTIRAGIRENAYRLVIGTDAASEGLNLQRLGSLINLDLPWNPTRLEQRKGRIQRIGQVRDEVYVFNLRYHGSVEDRVHDLLSSRLAAIRDLFGQLPDTLEDAWVYVALREEQMAREVIDQVPTENPFELRYDRIEKVDWESCSVVLDRRSQLEELKRAW